MDETGTTLLRDPYQWPLAQSESGRDKALKLYSSLVMRRENFAARVSGERSLAVPGMRSGWLQYTRADGVLLSSQECSCVPASPVPLSWRAWVSQKRSAFIECRGSRGHGVVAWC